jgi:serine/threonine protein kinase/tetratricopeptide (TPR) repeat protein
MHPVSIGPYRILDQLGLGGMGVVYRAQHADSGVRVAVKTVRVPRQAHLAGIRREIRALMRIQHPGVVRIVAEGVAGGLPWYAMELLEGRTLRDYHRAIWQPFAQRETQQLSTRIEHKQHVQFESTVTGNPSKPPAPIPAMLPRTGRRVPAAAGKLGEALRPLHRLCGALAFLHGEGIVHRDLKPDNVFIRDDGSPVLVDFGIVSRVTQVGREVLEVAGLTTGTAGYMAPEQIRGERVDARADLYSLGCMLYEVVTGQSAFAGATGVLSEHHLYTDPGPPSELVDGLSAPLEDLIMRLMAKAPRERIGHADDVDVALSEMLGEPRPPRALEPQPYLYRPMMVGRSEAREQLYARLARAIDGAGACVLIAGESGVGKTCLAGDVARVATLRGMNVITGECVPGGLGSGPLHPLRALLLAAADRCHEHGVQALERLLGARARVLAAVEPVLGALPGANGYPEPPDLPAEAAQRRLLDALAETALAFAEEKPLLLILDDLQWADELTLKFLATLPETFFRRRLVVLATYRSEETSASLRDLERAPRVIRLELERLDAATVGAIVSEMLALPHPPPEFVEFLARQSEGNPFFVAEYLRAAVAERILRRDRSGQWQIAEGSRNYQALPLPGLLRDLVARRLDGLPQNARALADAAAVLGREFDPELLPRVASLEDAATLEAIDELIARHVIEADEALGRLRFVHDKLREIAYDKIAAERRRALHLAAARAIEARYESGNLPQVYTVLAHHYSLAGDDAKTFQYRGLAGDQALRNAAYGEAHDHFTRALALDDERGRVAPPLDRARWEHGAGKAQFGLGDLSASENFTRHALLRLGHKLPTANGGWVRMLLGQLVRQLFHLAGLFRGGARQSSRRESIGEAALAASLMTHRYFYIDDSLKMLTASLLSVNLAERAGLAERVPRSYSLLGLIAGLIGRHKLAERYFENARKGAQDTNDSAEFAFALIAEAVYQASFGRWLPAEQAATRALERLRDVHDPLLSELTLTTMGHVEFFTGRFTQARGRFDEVLRLARERGNQQHATWGLFSIGRSLVQLGRFGEAQPLLEEARAELAKKPELPSEIICLGVLALARLRSSASGAAPDDATLALADETLERIGRARPAGFPNLEGYLGALEVYLAAWDRAQPRARRLVKLLAKFAKAFPMAVPAAHLYAGHAERAAGAIARAQSLYERSLHEARQLGMPREEAWAHLALAQVSAPQSPTQKTHLDEAAARFQRMECAWHLEQVAALRGAQP